jgi:hypothetical protein
MKENEEDVVHAGIGSKSQKIREFRSISEFATDPALPGRIARDQARSSRRCWLLPRHSPQ